MLVVAPESNKSFLSSPHFQVQIPAIPHSGRAQRIYNVALALSRRHIAARSSAAGCVPATPSAPAECPCTGELSTVSPEISEAPPFPCPSREPEESPSATSRVPNWVVPKGSSTPLNGGALQALGMSLPPRAALVFLRSLKSI